MKFLKGIMSRNRDEVDEETQPDMSIETFQADLDQSGLQSTLHDRGTAWGEKAAQRALEEHDEGEAAIEPLTKREATPQPDLDWDDESDEDEEGETESAGAFDAPVAGRQSRPIVENDFSGDEEFDDEFDELEPEEEQAIRDNAILVEEIRDAIAAVRHIEAEEGGAAQVEAARTVDSRKEWENDDVFGRKAIARDRLAQLSESSDGDRILEEMNTKMFDDDAANRRRQAMAHLKAAAAATKADSVLKRVVGRDPATDPDQQVQYREDLATVVRQKGPRSEPISRPLSRPRSRPISTPAPEAQAPDIDDVSAIPEPTEQPLTYEELRQAFSRQEAEAQSNAPDPQDPTIENPEPAEATMDVEKIDLKTALERQKAILKAEREALEAEIAAGEPSSDDQMEFEVERAAEGEAEESPADPIAALRAMRTADPEIEETAAFEDSFEQEELHSDDEADQNEEDWDTGEASVELDEALIENEDEEEEADIPVDVTSLARQVEDSVAPEEEESQPDPVDEAPEEVMELDLGEEAESATAEPLEEPAPSAASTSRKAGRVKTRLLGFQAKADAKDVFAGAAARGGGPVRFPVGWLVVTQGAGFGHSFSLLSGVSKIGRGDDQAVQLDFGDTAISRDNHAAIAFDDELNQFFLGHGGKSNVVRLNGKPVLSTEEIYDGDEIRIGETTLKFIALCNEDFTWGETAGNDDDHARSA